MVLQRNEHLAKSQKWQAESPLDLCKLTFQISSIIPLVGILLNSSWWVSAITYPKEELEKSAAVGCVELWSACDLTVIRSPTNESASLSAQNNFLLQEKSSNLLSWNNDAINVRKSGKNIGWWEPSPETIPHQLVMIMYEDSRISDLFGPRRKNLPWPAIISK